jgi:hypothetical protein
LDGTGESYSTDFFGDRHLNPEDSTKKLVRS